MYVLVTNMDPMKVYLYHDGLVRFATTPYTNSPEHYSDKFVHLTNYSVNKNSKEFKYNTKHDEYRKVKHILFTS